MRKLAAMWFGFNLLAGAAHLPAAEQSDPWYGTLTPASFRALLEAQRPITANPWREDLLSAAIFHETNRRREQLHLPPFRFQAEVRAAALDHTQWMAQHRQLTHQTPQRPGLASPGERLQHAGLHLRYGAENVAFTFLLQYQSGKPFYTRQEGGRTVRSYTPDGPPLAPHTYVSFAEAILTQWMNSPGHRANIVAKEGEALGVGCALAPDPNGLDTIYATQNFFAPMPPPTE